LGEEEELLRGMDVVAEAVGLRIEQRNRDERGIIWQLKELRRPDAAVRGVSKGRTKSTTTSPSCSCTEKRSASLGRSVMLDS
jgi:hypothetical protein